MAAALTLLISRRGVGAEVGLEGFAKAPKTK